MPPASRRKRSPVRMPSAERLQNLPPMRGLPSTRFVLDGGLATQLEAMGEDLSGSLWSARLLNDSPETIVRAHAAFLEAGADLIISASYQCCVPLLQEKLEIDASRAEELIAESVVLAMRARDEAGRPEAVVAASIGPYGACLADGSEYTGSYAADVGGDMSDAGSANRGRRTHIVSHALLTDLRSTRCGEQRSPRGTGAGLKSSHALALMCSCVRLCRVVPRPAPSSPSSARHLTLKQPSASRASPRQSYAQANVCVMPSPT
jgi:hypothetical protein